MLDKFFKTIEKITPQKWRWILNHEGFKRYFANTGWMFGGRVFSISVSFFVGIYIARYLGPSNYGLFSYAISFAGLFYFLTSFGIDGIINREIVKNNKKKDEIIGTGFYIKIIGSLLAIISVFTISFFTTKDFLTMILIWIFSLSFIPQAFNIIEIYFQSQVLLKKVFIAQILSNIISAILKIMCIFLGKGIFWLMLVCVIETTVYSVILLYLFRNFGEYIGKWKFNYTIAKNLLKDSWPLMLSSVAVGIYMRIDQVMIKNILGNEQAGIYAVVVKLSEGWYFIPMLVCASLSPAIIKAASISLELFENRMRKLYFLMFWFSLIVAFFTTSLAYPIVKLLFGMQYIESVKILQIYAWSGVGVSMGLAVGQYLLTNNLTKISFYTTILGAVINVIVNLILIPKIGIKGAAIATIVSYLIANFGIIIFKRSRQQGYLMIKSIICYK